MLERNRHARVGAERYGARQHFVADDAQGIEIAAAVELDSLDLFGTHVARRTDQHARYRERSTAVHGTRDAEIGEYGRAVLAEQDVLGLDVAMHEALAMGDVQCTAQRDAHVHDLLRAATPTQNPLLEVAAGQIFHRQVVVRLMLADVEHRNDGRMMNVRNDARFTDEPGGETRIGIQQRRHDLQRDFALETLLDR